MCAEVSRILFSHFEVYLFWQNPISEGVLEEVNMPNPCGYVGVEGDQSAQNAILAFKIVEAVHHVAHATGFLHVLVITNKQIIPDNNM